MPTPPRRKRFQIHLATAIVMMCVTGGLMWMNVTPDKQAISGFGTIDGIVIRYGWPFQGVAQMAYYFSESKEPIPSLDKWHFDWRLLAIDFLMAPFVLTLLYLLCDHLIRRRAARKDA